MGSMVFFRKLIVYLSVIICVTAAGAQLAMLRAEKMEKGYEGKGGVITVGIRDSGKEVYLRKGDIIQIELETLGTAGYSWQFDDLDRERLEVVSDETRALSDRMGAPALCIWRLKAGKSGSATITMSNYRVWEGKENSIKQFSITVKIE